MKYRYTHKDARKFHKYGVDLTVYGEAVASCNPVLVEVKVGHLEEFYDQKSTYMYLILEGEGTFMLNDEPVRASPKDLIVIPPKTRIYYFGTMKMVLCVTPAFDEKNERHVRMVDASESPYVAERTQHGS